MTIRRMRSIGRQEARRHFGTKEMDGAPPSPPSALASASFTFSHASEGRYCSSCARMVQPARRRLLFLSPGLHSEWESAGA